MAFASLLASIVLPGAAGCGVAFLATTDDPNATKDGGTTLLDSSIALTDGGSVPPPGDAGVVDAVVIDTCPQLGATRACTFADKSPGVQTCAPQPSGPSVWSDCVSTSCNGAVVPSGAAASCIPAGTFDMGGIAATTAPAEPDTLPAHSVKMQHRFYMDQYEVSVGEFASWWSGGAAAHPAIDTVIYVSGSGDVRKWTAADDASVAAPGTGLNCNVNANKPLVSINCVTQATALAYCVAKKGRLPTEAEWEYAASGQGKGNLYPWGGATPTLVEEKSCLLTIDSVCVATNGGPFPRPSAADGDTKPDLGSLNNLAGNVAEWTLDFAPSAGAQCASGACWPSGASDPWASKDNGTGSVVRGGSYVSTVDQVRTKARAFASAVTPPIPASIGFRCLRTD